MGGVSTQKGGLAPGSNRASSSVRSLGIAENMRRDHACGLVGRRRISHLFAFLCISCISGVWGRVIWSGGARGLKRERERYVL